MIKLIFIKDVNRRCFDLHLVQFQLDKTQNSGLSLSIRVNAAIKVLFSHS